MTRKSPANTKRYRGEIITPKMRLTRAAEVRGQIQTSKYIERLDKHIDGKLDLSPTQVRSAEILLKKVLPDLQVQDLHHHDESEQLTDDQMLAKLQAMLASLPPETRQALLSAAPLH